MEQFNLDKWLQNKSRKVTTRLGNREVRIICWDRKNNNNKPIITLMIDPDGNEYTTFHTENGFVDEKEEYIDKRDLFFADEEEELTEFDYAVLSIISDHNSHTDSIEAFAKRSSKKLLDLARKELQQEFKEEYDRGYSIGKFDAGEAKVKELVAEFEKGRANALKDLPKWKKSNDNLRLNAIVSHLLDNVLYWEGYYIWMKDLEKLPKEE